MSFGVRPVTLHGYHHVGGGDGAVGPAGPQGPVGPQGLQGTQGAQGNVGPTGADGSAPTLAVSGVGTVIGYGMNYAGVTTGYNLDNQGPGGASIVADDNTKQASEDYWQTLWSLTPGAGWTNGKKLTVEFIREIAAIANLPSSSGGTFRCRWRIRYGNVDLFHTDSTKTVSDTNYQGYLPEDDPANPLGGGNFPSTHASQRRMLIEFRRFGNYILTGGYEENDQDAAINNPLLGMNEHLNSYHAYATGTNGGTSFAANDGSKRHVVFNDSTQLHLDWQWTEINTAANVSDSNRTVDSLSLSTIGDSSVVGTLVPDDGAGTFDAPFPGYAYVRMIYGRASLE